MRCRFEILVSVEVGMILVSVLISASAKEDVVPVSSFSELEGAAVA
jgi:hypothetical protein